MNLELKREDKTSVFYTGKRAPGDMCKGKFSRQWLRLERVRLEQDLNLGFENGE